MNSDTFSHQLSNGRLGEGEIARFLMRLGYQVLPAYEAEQGSGKGPRIFGAAGNLIAPDMLVFNASRVLWVEAKTKSAFTWHWTTGTWQTGINLRHWHHYVQVDEQSPWPVWLLFLHRRGFLAKDTPPGKVSPHGLYGNSIAHLKAHQHHEYQEDKPWGMIYWTIDALNRINEYDESLLDNGHEK